MSFKVCDKCNNSSIMKDAVRVGRAHYICPECKRDVTIQIVLMYEALESDKLEKKRRGKNVRNKKYKSKSDK